ncbi:hypothetical protein [Glycomyces buryatensis]|uniref:Uncharacterized protein n=1 Tax=Glycomyces buryatensis TaxID=2570927 RepID=A0A4S8QA48_9ACTN|nr:hypothetical protein [Glycomyces buryatensis]THV41208.1 hypothetical protein FAB82_12805 [Glycomyces buryatensis]
MVETAAPGEEGPYNLRSDGEPGIDGYLGDFRRGPAVFTLYEIVPPSSEYPRGPVEYLLDVDDGAGPRLCCRFTDDPEDPIVWRGAWNGDQWCDWIMEQTRGLIADPDCSGH